MGCTPSIISPHENAAKLIDLPTNNNSYNHTVQNNFIETPEKNLINNAQSLTGIALDARSLIVLTSPSSMVVVTTLARHRGHKKKLRPLFTHSAIIKEEEPPPVTVQEETTERPPFLEKSSFELPLADFGDGQLGITEKETLSELQNSIVPGELFVDSEFPAENQSLYFVETEDNDIVWKRPHEMVTDPQMFVKGVDRKDVVQGILGDCWFLSSCAAVAMTPKLIERVVSADQKLYGDDYNGLIVCHFWRFGEWIHVCIDDYLPTKNERLIYARCAVENEFWVALLEKAYAKIHGSYQALEGGQSMNAMIDLTGGLAERYDIEDSPDPKKLFRYLSKASKTGAFITASRKGDWTKAIKPDIQGLVEGHAYTVSGVSKVEHSKKGTVPLIRIRNPFGNHIEWTGMWSDGDQMWDFVPKLVRKKLLTDDRFDGEFWMSFEDFYKEFEEISLCMMGPDFDGDGENDKVGQVAAIKGEWITGVNAGGCRKDFEKFSTNPQYLLTIADSLDEVEDDLLGYSESSDTTPVLIGLMQEHRHTTKSEGVKLHQIAFSIYKTYDPSERLELNHFLYNYDEGTSGTYINYREVICRLELLPGNYVIIPATFEPNTDGRFMIRVYSPKKFELNSLG